MKTLLFKPFENYSDKILLTAGIGFTLLGSLMGYWFNARFDGVLDLHFAINVDLFQPLFDNLLNIFSLGLPLFIVAKFLNKKTRLLDILITAMLSRVPYYLSSLGNITGYMSEMSEKMMRVLNPQTTDIQNANPQKIMEATMDNMPFLMISSVVSILAIVWYIVLLWNGFKTASHAKGALAIVLFILAILVAEVISKILIYNLI